MTPSPSPSLCLSTLVGSPPEQATDGRRWEPLQLLLFSFARIRPSVGRADAERANLVRCVYRRRRKCVKMAHGGRVFPE